MKFNHHNVTGPSPTLTEFTRFAFERDHRVDICRGALVETGLAVVYAYTPNRDTALLSDLMRSGWAFQHDPISERRGEFRILVRLEGRE